MPLMSYEDYQKLGRHPIPYILKIEKGKKSLFYFGEEHSYDPGHSQFVQLKKLWDEFVASNIDNPKVVLTEGGVRSVTPSEQEAITKYGGMGLMSYFAHQESVPFYSPEPNEIQERNRLLERFSKEEIEYYYFARVVAQWNRHQIPRPEFEQYINGYLEDDKKESAWADFDFSLANLRAIHEKFFDGEFNPEDSKHFYDVSKPTVLTTRINEVSREVGEIRDEHIAKQIQKYWLDGNSIFAVYGCTHVVRQEPLLKELLLNSGSHSIH